MKVATISLPRLEGNGRLCGRFVRVRCAGWLNTEDGSSVRRIPLGDVGADPEGDFVFDPDRGGERQDRALLLHPEDRQRHLEAARFGQVNAYFHLDRIAAYIDSLLRGLGAPSLPPIVAVTEAHADAVERDGRRVAFQGGHYRLPSARQNVPEPEPISPDGEIHLGPGRELLSQGALAEAAGRAYRHNASHNAGILYHEYGHHVSRHTADFCRNAERPADRQSNRKPALDEGSCDYWAAVMLEASHIWSWHRSPDHPRNLSSTKTMAAFDPSPDADPHANGTIWAAALWDLRARLGPATDAMVLETLRVLGRRSGDRESFESGLSALLEAERRLHGGKHRREILDVFEARAVGAEA